MNKRQRVLSTIEKKPVDHVPVGFWYHFMDEKALGEPCVQAHVDYVRDCDLDMLKIMCDGYFPYPVPEDIKTASDWWKLEPIGKNHPFIRQQVQRASRLVDLMGAEVATFYNVFAPFSSLRFGAGDDRVMNDLREDPLAVRHALDVVAQDNATLAEELLRTAGCDGVYYCVQGAEYGRLTEKEYREMIRPSDLYVLERANRYSGHNILHCCGWAGTKNQLCVWQDYPVACVNWAVYVEQMSLTEGRAFFGNKACLGGFESLHRDGMTHKGLLHNASKEEIGAFTRDTILSFGKTGLLLGADCTVNSFIDHERIRWVVEAARSI
ncbi:MAG: hypothetical protein IJJ23_12180 [Clostridia bacterium]|nr:hypothetical protein [Clostridia bacterium]